MHVTLRSKCSPLIVRLPDFVVLHPLHMSTKTFFLTLSPVPLKLAESEPLMVISKTFLSIFLGNVYRRYPSSRILTASLTSLTPVDFVTRCTSTGHLTEIQTGSKTRLICAGGGLKRWFFWEERGVAVHRSWTDRTDSPFVGMAEKVDYKRRLSVIIVRYACRISFWRFRHFFLCGQLGFVLEGPSLRLLLVKIVFVSLARAAGRRCAAPTCSFWPMGPHTITEEKYWRVWSSLYQKISRLCCPWRSRLEFVLRSPVLAHTHATRLLFLQSACIQHTFTLFFVRLLLQSSARARFYVSCIRRAATFQAYWVGPPLFGLATRPLADNVCSSGLVSTA